MTDTITPEKKVVKVKKDYILAIGRRKSATARIRLYLNQKGDIEVNGKRIEEYFPGELNHSEYVEPLRTCNLIGKHFISVKVTGSGKKSQIAAIVHGISRAIDKLEPEKYHPILKKRGLLTRDPRARQRRKTGMGGKSRAKKQSPRR